MKRLYVSQLHLNASQNQLALLTTQPFQNYENRWQISMYTSQELMIYGNMFIRRPEQILECQAYAHT